MIRSVRCAVIGAFILAAPMLFSQADPSAMPEPKPIAPAAIVDTESTAVVPEALRMDAETRETFAALWFLDPGDPFESLSFEPVAAVAQAAGPTSDADTGSITEAELKGLLNNPYYRDSLKLTALAKEAFEYGDYDASANYAAQAAEAARRSDQYVAMMIKMKNAKDGLAAARARLDWASSVGAERRYPRAYSDATSAYDEAAAAYSREDWDASIEASRRVAALLADVSDMAALPSTYTVRTWAEYRDCFWNISGYPFVYGDPTKWRTLYEANKKKLPRPDNPDLIYPGTVLSIPSLRGEVREGMWVKDRAYEPLPKRK